MLGGSPVRFKSQLNTSGSRFSSFGFVKIGMILCIDLKTFLSCY